MRQPRWRVTLDQVCALAGTNAAELHRWCVLGALGRERQERPYGGYGRHWTRLETQRAVLVGRMVKSGLGVSLAGQVASNHRLNEGGLLSVEIGGGVTVTVDRSDLP